MATSFFDKHRDKIEVAGPDDCWLWTAAKINTGYGSVRARGKTRSAHREAYEDVHGYGAADGLVVRHRCDVRACINPAHLDIGTHADNMRDMCERGRQSRQRGSAHARAKLTEQIVRKIKAEYVRGCRVNGTRALARRYGVDHSIVSEIVSRKRWGHVS